MLRAGGRSSGRHHRTPRAPSTHHGGPSHTAAHRGGPSHTAAHRGGASRTPTSPRGRSRAGRVVLDAGPGIAPSVLRRLLDIVVAAGALLLLWPLFVCVAVATVLSTGGSPIYRQLRVGQGGVAFTLLKFRTMRVRMPGPEVTPPGDPRVTRLGAVLRRTSIDELPQVLNVLFGRMTLVGPRPESVALAVRYPPEYRFVFRYRPGLTGPSQVLEHDDAMLQQVSDVEGFYLNYLVPRRIRTDLAFLQCPTFVMTVRWLVNTARYLAHSPLPVRDPALLREGDDIAEPRPVS